MDWLARLCWWAAWTCAALAGLGEAARRQLCADSNIFTMEVHRGDSRSLILSINSTLKLVEKYDPETKKYKEQILAGPGTSNSLKDKHASISLVNQNFTVWNATGTEEGLYRIIQHIDDRCLAVVNVTVLDLPLPATVTPSFNVSSNFTKTVKASSPGINYTAISVAVPVVGLILFVGGFFIVRKLIKRRSECK